MYTYEIKNNNIAVIRLSNSNDFEENLFDDLKVLKTQLQKEGFKINYNF